MTGHFSENLSLQWHITYSQNSLHVIGRNGGPNFSQKIKLFEDLEEFKLIIALFNAPDPLQIEKEINEEKKENSATHCNGKSNTTKQIGSLH